MATEAGCYPFKHARAPLGGLVLPALLLGLLAAGCRSAGSRGMPRFEVELSFLDYATLTYFEERDGADETHPLLRRVELSGSCHVQYAMGRSSRVSEGFWQQSDEKYWHDLYTDQLVIGEAETQAFFQALVNAGALDRKRQGRHIEKPGTDYVFVHVRINGRDGVLATDDPAFLKIFRDLEACLKR